MKTNQYPTSRFLVSLFVTAVLFLLSIPSKSQRITDTNNQYWLGYMTSVSLTKKVSLWNDFHLVPEGFAVVRTGLTYHVNKAAFTGGYAFVWLPAGSGSTSLKRHEHRPWGQAQFSLPVSGRFTYTQRIRYDARFRERLFEGETIDGFLFNHRVRFLSSIKRTLSANPDRRYIPYATLSNEVLLNFGKDVTWNTFDQNRISIAVGVQSSSTQYQLGLMNRFVQTGSGKFTLNHTLVLWITQKFMLRGHQNPS